MKKRSVLVSFAALTVLLTAGAAQSLSGTNTVDSGDIIDRTIGTPDVKVGAFAGQTILDNSMTTNDINEETLKFPTAEGKDSLCLDDSVPATPEECASTTITLAKPGKVWINVTYEFESDPGTTDESGTVRLLVNGTVTESHFINDNADTNRYPMPIQDLVSLGAGTHTIKLTFQEGDDAEDVDVINSHIVAVRVSS